MTEGREATLAPSMIVPGDNDRTAFDADQLATLAADIKHQGLLQRPTVRQIGPQRYELVYGERRFRAMRDVLHMGGIPVLVVDWDDDRAADAMLAENLTRVDLSPMMEARAFAKAIGRGLSQAELARRHGLPMSRVSRRLALLELDPACQEGVDIGALPLWAAEILGQLDRNRQRVALAQYLGNPTMARETLALVVGHLVAQRDQDAMFDPTDFTLQVETWDRAAKRGRDLSRTQPAVGRADIPKLLDVKADRVYQWHKRGQLPEPDFTVNGQPAWLTPKILEWAATSMPQSRPRKG